MTNDGEVRHRGEGRGARAPSRAFPAPLPETVLTLVSWTPHPSSKRSWRGNWTTVGGEGACAPRERRLANDERMTQRAMTHDA
jgi:hypothetical protein